MGKPVFGSKNSLTFTEVHAVVLGLVVGAMIGYGYSRGHTEAAVGTTVVFVAIALGVRKRGHLSNAQNTLQREPWYALAAFVVGAAVGAVI